LELVFSCLDRGYGFEGRRLQIKNFHHVISNVYTKMMALDHLAKVVFAKFFYGKTTPPSIVFGRKPLCTVCTYGVDSYFHMLKGKISP
jgi:hypothetical protein